MSTNIGHRHDHVPETEQVREPKNHETVGTYGIKH